MARPQRCRRIKECPEYIEFSTKDCRNREIVSMTMDEYETIYLVDYEGLTHSECSECMDISRTTVTEIYNSARRKVADFIVGGKRLIISGGNCRFSDANDEIYYAKHGCGERTFCHAEEVLQEKGNDVMRIAVTYLDGKIFQHFGKTSEFKVYDIEEKKVVKSEVLSTNNAGHGALIGFLIEAEVDVLICGGMGEGAKMNLQTAGIKRIAGISGNADDAVAKFIEGTLEGRDVVCEHAHEHSDNHHDHHHNHHHDHHHNHNCSNHECGHEHTGRNHCGRIVSDDKKTEEVSDK